MSRPHAGSKRLDGLVDRLRASPARYVLLLMLDGAIAALSLWAAMLLRFEGHITPPYEQALPVFLAVLVPARVFASAILRLHRWSFLFSGLPDGARIGLAALLGTGLFMSVIFFLQHVGPPRSVIAMELLLSAVLMTAVRFSPRLATVYLADLSRARRAGTQRTIIVGAGAAGEMLARDLQRSSGHVYQIVGFVDDDSSKWGSIVGGRPVLGAVEDLPRLAAQHRVGTVLIAIPRLGSARVREILSLSAASKLSFKILPVSFTYFRDRSASAALQDLAPEDLLPRERVSLGERGRSEKVAGRSVLVTGAAGSIGSEISRQLLRAGVAGLTLVDNNENSLYLLVRRFEREFPGAPLAATIADVKDAGRMQALFAVHRPDDVFHAAAHKHVPLMEAAPCEAVKNNVLGTRNVIEAAVAVGAQRFVFISTDKAVRPTSVMGASKRVAEMLVRAAAAQSATRFCAVRFGNVLGSAGSVVPIFRDQIAAGGPLTVTHPEVRRYFMIIAEAVELVLTAAYGDYGDLCVLEMGEQIRIVDLARHMVTMAGLAPDVDIPIVFTGLRPGEKLSEELLTDEEEKTRRVSDKICATDSPRPPADLDRQLDELIAVAQLERDTEVVSLLRRLVPSYRVPAGAPDSPSQEREPGTPAAR